MWPALAALALALAVLLTPMALEDRSDSTPPPEAVARTAALGRAYAASDLMWLATVQLIGDSAAERRRWPALERWVDLTTTLDPSFETPYFFGATLLVSDPTRAAAADALLERGQRAMPETFSFPMMRGFIAYFSRLDPATAAVHYRRAASLPGAPRYLEAFARRLETQVHTCAEMLRNLSALAAEESADKRQALQAEREPILLACIEAQLKNAAAAYRNQHLRDASLSELRAAGLITEVPYAPPGQCWVIKTGRPSLLPCPLGGSTP